jgi:hypothetical protein
MAGPAAIHYPRAVFDDQLGEWVSDAEVAFTAFRSKPKARQVSARLIVRRVRDANPDHVSVDAQRELFQVWRHHVNHVVFSGSPLPMLDAECDHRRRAIIEQVIAVEKWATGASALRVLRRELRVADARRDGLQPDPRRRRAHLELSRQSHHRDHPLSADHCRRPRHPLGTTIIATTTQSLALGRSMATVVQRRNRATSRSSETAHRRKADRRPVEMPNRWAIHHALPH